MKGGVQADQVDIYDRLLVPREQVYPVEDGEVAARLGVDSWENRTGGP